MPHRKAKVWVRKIVNGVEHNYYLKDGKLEEQLCDVSEAFLPENGFTPFLEADMNMIADVFEAIAEEYPSSGMVKRSEYDRKVSELTGKVNFLSDETEKAKGKYDKMVDAYVMVTSNGVPVMATLESTVDEVTEVEKNRPRPAADVPVGGDDVDALVDSWPWGWRDVVGYLFAGAVCSGIMMAAGRAFRMW